jgi:hypothetical protein
MLYLKKSFEQFLYKKIIPWYLGLIETQVLNSCQDKIFDVCTDVAQGVAFIGVKVVKCYA